MEQLKKNLSPEASIVDRMRSVFEARRVGGESALAALIDCLKQAGNDSVLFRHEVAYVMGQMDDLSAVPTLVKLLDDDNEHVMVRHEAGEALGALKAKDALPVLNKYLTHDSEPLRETCILAAQRVTEDASKPKEPEKSSFYMYNSGSEFVTVDPVAIKNPPKDPEALCKTLESKQSSLRERYDALFGLRKIGGSVSAEGMAQVLRSDEESALLRHEISFVLGQMCETSSLKYLVESLKDGNENEMVRHESALALGSVGSKLDGEERDGLIEVLKEYSGENNPIVGESCMVALDNLGVAF